MPNLYLKLKHLPENLPANLALNEKAWGEIKLSVDDGFDLQDIFSTEGNMLEMMTWYTRVHLPNLLHPCQIPKALNESLAEAAMGKNFLRTYRAFFIEKQINEAFFDHSLKIPPITIGRTSDANGDPSEGEISLVQPDNISERSNLRFLKGTWAYPISLKQYYEDARLELIQCLEQWVELAPSEWSKNDAQRLFRIVLDSPEEFHA